MAVKRLRRDAPRRPVSSIPAFTGSRLPSRESPTHFPLSNDSPGYPLSGSPGPWGPRPIPAAPSVVRGELLEELGALVELLGVARIRLLEACGVLLERVCTRTARTGAARARAGTRRSVPGPRAAGRTAE